MGVVKEDTQIEGTQMDGDRQAQKRIICFGAPINGTCQKWMKRKVGACLGII